MHMLLVVVNTIFFSNDTFDMWLLLRYLVSRFVPSQAELIANYQSFNSINN